MPHSWFAKITAGKLCLSLTVGALLSPKLSAADKPPKLCAAIQGNGDAIFAHFHSLARIISHYGIIDAAAGSSSATITMFLLESMMMNPAIKDCKSCSSDDKAQRVSLMLKSLVGFFEMNQTRKEAFALYDFLQQVKDVKKVGFSARSDNKLHLELDEDDYLNIRKILGQLHNPRFEKLFRNSPNRGFHFQDYKEALSRGAFKVDTNRVFLRPFPVSFDGVANVIGWMGDFYAARNYQNKAHWESWFDTCQPETLKEKTWGDIAYYGYHAQQITHFHNHHPWWQATPCRKAFEILMSDYRDHDKSGGTNHRVDEKVGKLLPAYPITGLLVGTGAQKIEEAKAAYWAAQPEIDLKLDYDTEFRVGYFGTADALEKIHRKVDLEKQKRTLDVKTSKFYPLAGYTWRDVFRTSPAEPSISEAIELSPTLVSVGGWADLFPSTILKMAECENTFYITSERKSFDLVEKVNALLGGGDSRYVESALARGLEDSDAVWCTNWSAMTDYLKIENVYALTESSFAAGLNSSRAYFLQRDLTKPVGTPRYGCHPIAPVN